MSSQKPKLLEDEEDRENPQEQNEQTRVVYVQLYYFYL